MRTLPLLFAACLLAGCAAPGTPASFTERQERPASEAYVLPPPGGPRVLTVVEERFINAISQNVYLATNSDLAGENRLSGQFFGPYRANTGADNRLFDSPLDRPHVLEELRREFPGTPMAISTLYVSNKYGPFGYAMGRRGADLCIFAWQRIASVATGTTLFDPRGTIAVRLRLCETGASEDRLLAVMYGYTINARIGGRNWNPYGRPVGVSDDIGRPGAPAVMPVGPLGSATVLDGVLGPEPAPPPQPRVRRTASEPAATQPRPEEIYRDYPQVPAPPPG